MGCEGSSTPAGPLHLSTLVVAPGCPGPSPPGRQGGLPAALAPRRRPAPQPAGGGGLGSVARQWTPGPYFPLGQGQTLLHTEDMGTLEPEVMVLNTACRWVTAAAPQPMPSTEACHRLLRTVLCSAPRHALTREVWRALLSHHMESMRWEATPGAR